MQKFSEIIGQKAIKDHIYNALRTGSVSHAYILNGDAGSGRKTLAYTFAAALQCEDLQEETVAGVGTAAAAGEATAAGAAAAGEATAAEPQHYLEPCGRCLSCIQAESRNHPDIITVAHEKPASISVGEIRRMRADVQIKPYSSARKIYIIPDAEKLTIQAQNALLKTLEEPPEYAVIILIADGLAGFLPTILSRCVVLQMRAVEEAQIAEFLQRRQNIDPDKAQIIARFAGGNPGKALLLTEDREFMELRDRAVDFLAHIGRADAVQISEFSSGVDPARRDDLLGLVLM
jgi:DNA polymerase-3 subunit delta'